MSGEERSEGTPGGAQPEGTLPGKVNLRWFLLASLALHLLAIALVLSVPKKQVKLTATPYIVGIIAEEPPPTPPPPPMPRPSPVPPKAEAPARRAVPQRPLPEKAGPVEAPPEAEKPPEGEGGAEAPGEEKALALPAERDLLDPGVIGDVARAGEPKKEAPAEGKEGGITFDVSELKYRSYMMRLKERIEDIWEYPPGAARDKTYGDLYITFVIRKDGTLGSVKLTRTSGYAELDEAALRALRESAPFWPLPDGWEEESLTIDGHFIYALYGMFLR